MFTATELRFIRETHLGDLQKLLSLLRISEPNWDDGNGIKFYEQLDDKIVSRVCTLTKSESIIDGYIKLMQLGGLPFDYSETYNELLDTIVKNKNAVMRGATQAVQSQQTSVKSQSRKVTKTVEKKILLPGFIVVGFLLIIAAIVLAVQDLAIGAGITGILGIIGLLLGVKGKTVKETVVVDGEPVQKNVTSESKKAAFTNSEIQKIFEVLTQIQKIVHLI